MSHKIRSSAGFTILELALVLIVVGLIASALLPLASDVHDNTLRDTDDGRMEVIRDALMGYIRINEAVPCVAGGVQVANGCDPTDTLDLLGVRSTDARGRSFVLDVNDDLTEATLAAGGNICTALANIISPIGAPVPPPTLVPQVCNAANANTGSTACTPATSPTMAFVLVGRGSDRCLNLENTHATSPNFATCAAGVADNRTFENPARQRSRDVDDGYYDDLVLSMTPVELAEALGCPAGGSGMAFTFCPANEALVQVSNGDNSWLSIGASGSCYAIAAGTTASMGCQPDGTTLTVHSNQSCGPVIVNDTLANLDTNSDGRADIVCDNTTTCSWR